LRLAQLTFLPKKLSQSASFLPFLQSITVLFALTLFPPLIYEEDHAYDILFTGTRTEQDVQTITRGDLVNFKNTWLRPDNATIFVVGDTTLDAIKPMLEKEFGKWKVKGNKGTKQFERKGRGITRPFLLCAGHGA
jgi:predicted Zn-dependent peptidase